MLLSLIGADGQIDAYGSEYLFVIGLGSLLQVFGTGLIPLIRNDGGSFWSMVSMVLGFITNIILDDALVMIIPMGMTGAAIAPIIGQGVTMVSALIYTFRRKPIIFKTNEKQTAPIIAGILSTGLAPSVWQWRKIFHRLSPTDSLLPMAARRPLQILPSSHMSHASSISSCRVSAMAASRS